MAVRDLVTLANVRSYLSLKPNATQDDALLRIFISAVSEQALTMLGHEFEVKQRTEQIDALPGKTQYVLKAAPVHEVSSVKSDFDRLFPSTSVVAAEEYDAETKRRFGILTFDCPLLSPGRGALQVVYVGGYAFDRDLYIARQDDPPGSPSSGDIYLVGATPTGAWVGKANNVATYNGSTWIFKTAFEQAQESRPQISFAVLQQVAFLYRTKDYQGTNQNSHKQGSLQVNQAPWVASAKACLEAERRMLVED